MEIQEQFLKLFLPENQNTLILLFWLNSTLSILILIFRFSYFGKLNERPLLFFGGAKLLNSISFLLFFLREKESTGYVFLDLILPNSLLFVGYFLESLAILILIKSVSKKIFRLQYIILISDLLVFIGAVVLNSQIFIRIAIASGIFISLLFAPTIYLLKGKTNSLFKKILGIHYSIYLIAMVFRVWYFLNIQSTNSLINMGLVHSTMILMIFLLTLVNGVGYLLLLQEEKEFQIKKLLNDKDKFFSIIAHDLKGPFNGIIGLSELLLEKDNQFSQEEGNEFIKLINESSKNTYTLLENLLTWARSQTGNIQFSPKQFEISEITDKTISLLANIAKNKKITIYSEIDGNQLVVADKNMLETVFRNLISNAIKFTREKGEVTLSMERKNGKIIFSVKDNGVGIAPDDIENIFALNHRKNGIGTHNESGTGLGLMISKDFIEKHGGTIWVKSQLGEGSEFKFSIPDQINFAAKSLEK